MKKQIKNNMEEANSLLTQALLQLKEANKEGKQLDYTNAPSLSNEVDRAENLVKQINKIMYQE